MYNAWVVMNHPQVSLYISMHMFLCYFTTQCFNNDTMLKKFCTSESLHKVHQWSKIILIPPSSHHSMGGNPLPPWS